MANIPKGKGNSKFISYKEVINRSINSSLYLKKKKKKQQQQPFDNFTSRLSSYIVQLRDTLRGVYGRCSIELKICIFQRANWRIIMKITRQLQVRIRGSTVFSFAFECLDRLRINEQLRRGDYSYEKKKKKKKNVFGIEEKKDRTSKIYAIAIDDDDSQSSCVQTFRRKRWTSID